MSVKIIVIFLAYFYNFLLEHFLKVKKSAKIFYMYVKYSIFYFSWKAASHKQECVKMC